MSKTSLVLELQHLATDRRNDVTDLLRKALLVATKLRVSEFKEWAEHELEGYGQHELPKYRVVPYYLMALEGGVLKPIVFVGEPAVPESHEARIPLKFGLETLLQAIERGSLTLGLPSDADRLVRQATGTFDVLPCMRIDIAYIKGIVDAVRNTVLRWSLQLEAEGIMGDGMTFSEEEKRRAAASTEIHITNFQGVLGDIADSVVTQNLQMTVRQGDFASLTQYLRSQGVEDADIGQLEAALNSDHRPTKRGNLGPHVSDWIGKMVGKAASGATQLAIGTAGSLLAQAIWVYYGL